MVVPRKLDPLYVLYSQPALLAYGNAAAEWSFLGRFDEMLSDAQRMKVRSTTLPLFTIGGARRSGQMQMSATLRVDWLPVAGESDTPPPSDDEDASAGGGPRPPPSWRGRRWAYVAIAYALLPSTYLLRRALAHCRRAHLLYSLSLSFARAHPLSTSLSPLMCAATRSL